MGPIDYSINYPCGLLVDGFDSPPRVMNNHNRPYYAGLLESWGLRKAKDLYCWWFLDIHNMAQRWQQRAERLARRGNVVVRPFRLDDFEAEVARCREIYNQSMQNNWGFVGLSDAEFHYFAKRLQRLTTADLVLLAEVDGQPAGFSITVPDMNEAIRPLGGRLTNYGLPINLFRLLRRMRRIKTARMIVLDVLEAVSPPGSRRVADSPHPRLRQECRRLHRRRTGLDPGGQRPGQPHDRSRGGTALQDLPHLHEGSLIDSRFRGPIILTAFPRRKPP